MLRISGQNAGKVRQDFARVFDVGLGRRPVADTCLQSTFQGINTYIVRTGPKRIIIGTAQGYRAWADLVDNTLSKASVGLCQVLLTHLHGDHTGGVPDLISMHPALEDVIYKDSPDAGQRAIEDGKIWRIEGATLRAIHAPGHSHDQMCFLLEEENTTLTGVNVLGRGTSAVEELSVYTDSLRKLQGWKCDIGYPAHGAVIEKLPLKIARELAQKHRREKQCLLALNAIKHAARMTGKIGGGTVQELVVAMHGDGLDEEVRKLALEPFLDEVLRKLAEDGKVAFQIRTGVKSGSRSDSVKSTARNSLPHDRLTPPCMQIM